jgi:DNA-binding transcriptional ArsR family regulator
VAMGELSLSTSAIVLLCLHGAGEEGLPVSGIVKKTGLLQPTASMAVGSLEKKGLVERHLVEGEDAEGRRTSGPGTVGAEIVLTEAGAKRADEIAERVGRIVVRRRRHGACVAS